MSTGTEPSPGPSTMLSEEEEEQYHSDKRIPSEEYYSAMEEYCVSPSDEVSQAMNTSSKLLDLPPELIDHIFVFLEPQDLELIACTCSYLQHHSYKDLLWHRHVQNNVPGCLIQNPNPFATYRDLYYSHDPHWFLSKHKIWFCDYFLTGKVIIVRYDPRRGCMEGYRLVAERQTQEFEPWEHDDQVIIHSFNPHVKLHMDQPVLQLEAKSSDLLLPDGSPVIPKRHCSGEISMRIHDNLQANTYSNFILARPVEERPSMQLWPPPLIPAVHRVRNASQQSFTGRGHKPSKRSEVSDQAFRIRRWMERLMGHHRTGVHLGEEVQTYATLDPKLYTPTSDKPYRGIWVGDYSGHGCEFLLMHQPDNMASFDETSVVRNEDETMEQFFARRTDERIYRGRIEAIKLTGDPNVPRGEHTFIADDIGSEGFVRVADDERFYGARIVRSRGHIADNMFRDDQYIESQLILISPDRLAQYWMGFGHISFYQRVCIDDFTNPYTTGNFTARSS